MICHTRIATQRLTQASWDLGLFRDCNGESNGKALPPGSTYEIVPKNFKAVQLLNAMYLSETIAAEALCSGEETGLDFVVEDDYSEEQGFSDDEYYSEELESSLTSSVSSSSSYTSSFSTSTTPTLTSSRPIPRPSLNPGQSGTFSDNLRPNLVPTYLSPFRRDGFSQGERGRTGRKPATRFENLPSHKSQQLRNLKPRGQNTARRAKAPELLPITDGLARAKPRSRPRSGKALPSQKKEKVGQGKKLSQAFPPKTEDIERLRNWSTWHGSISTTEKPRVGRLIKRRKELVGAQTNTFPNSSFPPSRLHVPSGPARLESNSPSLPSSLSNIRHFGKQGRKIGSHLKTEQSVIGRSQAGNSNTIGPRNKPSDVRRQPNTISHSKKSKTKPKNKKKFQRRRNKFDGTITTSAPSFFQSSRRSSPLLPETGRGKEQPESSNSRSRNSLKTTSGFSPLLPGRERGEPKSSQLRSTQLAMDSKAKQSNGHIGNGLKGQKGGAERRFPETMREEVKESLLINNSPQTNRAGSVRGRTTSLTQKENFMKSLNGRLRSKVKTQKSKAPKASSERQGMSKNSKKQTTKEGRLGKALRKLVVGKALFTVEEWLRRG